MQAIGCRVHTQDQPGGIATGGAQDEGAVPGAEIEVNRAKSRGHLRKSSTVDPANLLAFHEVHGCPAWIGCADVPVGRATEESYLSLSVRFFPERLPGRWVRDMPSGSGVFTGSHVPSPLGRLLRQPGVPFSVLADPPFAVIYHRDAARAFVAAARQRLAEPINVVAPGAITALQALLCGRRIPIPVVGPDWSIIRRVSHLLGAPIPEHVLEVLHRGRLADGRRAREVLGFAPEASTAEVIKWLYAWQDVVRITPERSNVA